MLFNNILVNRNNSLVEFSINRPKALNAINFSVMNELEVLLNQLEANCPKIFVFKSKESGDYVASGGDLVQFSTLKTEVEGFKMATKMAEILKRIENLPCLTIAYLNGKIFGGGCEMSLAFDLIYTNKSTLMGFTQAKFALSPGWNGATRLVERVGKAKALQILLSQKKIMSEEAFSMGLSQEYFQSDEQFHQRLQQFLTYGVEVLIGIKNAVQTVSHQPNREEKMNEELKNFAKIWAADSHHKAVETFLTRKKY